MEFFLQSLLVGSTGLVAYATVFAILLACGLGVPLPEDISLILGGYLAHQGQANLPVMMCVGFLGILAGDSLIYLAGRRLGSKVGTGQGSGFFARVVTAEKRAKVEQMFARHGRKVVMIARFMPGVRAVTYFTAGSVRMSYWRFILWDGLAALLSAPLFVFAGFYFGDKLDLLIDKMKEGQMMVFGTLAVGVAAWFLLRRVRRQREAAAAAAVMAGAAQVRSDDVTHPLPTLQAVPKSDSGRTFGQRDVVGPQA